MKAIDRRRYFRLPKNYKVKVSLLRYPLGNQKWYEVHSLDIGKGGVRLIFPCKLDKGDKLQIKIRVPSLNKFHPSFFKVFEVETEQELVALGEVIWIGEKKIDGYEVGVKFIDVFEDDLRALRDFLEEQRGKG
ncbi:PilZ domain-containing protein [Desulfonauticus submarinus]|uniref:PilZ domain-containing protein n=1 Tax=Desulfonauticus submarinus TaxID=206665 RepID=A0A1H0CRY4_9BACT|nr:PilZ domain-containing protein [Desulfonauticus submarinus]SDN60633.1 PilZ domain-containing protein [Desulfonauticus submarinus]